MKNRRNRRIFSVKRRIRDRMKRKYTDLSHSSNESCRAKRYVEVDRWKYLEDGQLVDESADQTPRIGSDFSTSGRQPSP